jgi:ATP-dependent Clp protease ATP-binding subunit ClpX
VISHVKELTDDELVCVLEEPKHSLIKQYRRMFAFEGVELEFMDSALKAIAKEAVVHGTGARGLRSICERILLDTMYELPSNDAIAKVVVTPESVRGEAKPTMVIRSTDSKGKLAS